MGTPDSGRRSEKSRRAILDAAWDLCREQGYAATTIEGIARRAGVGKQTIYRWWTSKAEVVQEALNERVGTATDFPDTGDIVADLREPMVAVATMFASEEFSLYPRGLIAAGQTDPKAARSLVDSIVAPRVAACRRRLARAVEQGQLREDLDLDAVVELLYAPLYYRLVLQTRPTTPDQVDEILRLALDGIRSPAGGTRRTRAS